MKRTNHHTRWKERGTRIPYKEGVRKTPKQISEADCFPDSYAEALTFTKQFMMICRNAAKHEQNERLELRAWFTACPFDGDARHEVDAAWKAEAVILLSQFWEQMTVSLYESGTARWLRELADAVERCAPVRVQETDLRLWLLATLKQTGASDIPAPTIGKIKKAAEERFRRIFPVGVIRRACKELAIPWSAEGTVNRRGMGNCPGADRADRSQ